MALGFSHPDEMLLVLSSSQIAEWIAYSNVEPFGFNTEWLRTGMIASTIANVNRQKNTKAFAPEDFMPDEPKLFKKQSAEEQKEAILNLYSWAKKMKKTKG